MRDPKKAGHFDNRHSRWVARLKVVLPLFALAILSTVFLVADRRSANEASIPDEATLDRLLTEGRVAKPAFSGIGTDGASVSFTADEAVPDPENNNDVNAVRLSGTWQSRSGAEITVTGARGRLSRTNGNVDVTGDVVVTDAQGYQLLSDALQIDGKTKDILSPGPVVGTGPATRIEAGAMTIEQRSKSPRAIFTDGVRVIYDPDKAE